MTIRLRLSAGGRNRARSAGLALVVGSALLAGCGTSDPAELPRAASAEAALPAGLTEAELALLDRLVTPESIFPDAGQRALYRMQAPVTESGQRSYVFELMPRAGMTEGRHFQLIGISWARAGAFVKAPGAPAALGGSAGPNGGYVDARMQTADGVYDVRVSLGMLLPDAVDVPQFDIEKAAADQLRRYRIEKRRN